MSNDPQTAEKINLLLDEIVDLMFVDLIDPERCPKAALAHQNITELSQELVGMGVSDVDAEITAALVRFSTMSYPEKLRRLISVLPC